MRVDLNLQQLEAFVAVAVRGSFRQAALALGQSQPNLSRLVRQAEKVLGARLFDRDTRRVEITPVGRELLPRAQRILLDFDQDLGELGEFIGGRRGRVSLVALPSVSVALLPSIIESFATAQPNIQFSLVEAPADALLRSVEGGRVDFGISVRPAPQQRLQYRHLLDDPFVLVCRRDDSLAGLPSVAWSVFGDRPCIVSGPRSSIRPVTDAVFMRSRKPVQPVLEYPSVNCCGALIAAGVGITALPVLALRMLDMAALTAVPLQRPYMTRPIGIVTRIGRSLPPAARNFMDELQASSVKLTGSAYSSPVRD